MKELKFSDNYSDLSQQTGVSAGFQFEFYCERCNDRWRTEFVAFRSGQASGWMSKAAGFLGGIAGGAADALDGVARAGWGNAHDEAFQQSIEQAQRHFHRCARCFQYVCDVCWNNDKGLCLNCAPDVQTEVEAARTQGEIYGATENAALEGIRQGKKRDVKSEHQLKCPQCGAETKGAKFCPDCGFKLAQQNTCPACSAKVSPTAKFCPECGGKIAQ
jgi:rRNA maturation endonuclease Nob1